MKYLWIYYLPLLFLPNLGLETVTSFGTLTVSDYLIFPYIFLLFLACYPGRVYRVEPRAKLYIDYLIPTLLIFVWWAIVSSLSTIFRYNYTDYTPVIFSLLKLGKLVLYGVGAVLTIHALSKSGMKGHQRYLWAIWFSGQIVGISLLISGNSLINIFPTEKLNLPVFQENPISAMLSILIAFQLGMVIQGNGTKFWRSCTIAGLLIMVLGFVAAEGRGGWLAALAAMVYIGIKINLKQTLRLTGISVVLIALVYSQNIAFRKLVDRTLNPDPAYLEEYNIGVAGLDDGGRLSIFLTEAPKLLQDPFFGRGFFHRGGLSGLSSVGSHNFFLQMFLETGIIGGALILVLFRQMWRHASSQPATLGRLGMPIKAAIIAALVSGISGEYFYGGMVFFAFLLTYAPAGSLVVEKKVLMLHTSGWVHRTVARQR